MNEGRGPAAWALACAAVAVMGMGGVAVAAPKGDQGPPEHAQGNGPPSAPAEQQASPPAEEQAAAPQGKAKGHEKKAGGGQGGRGEAPGQAKPEPGGSGDQAGARKAHGQSKGGGQSQATTGGGESQEQRSSHAKAGKVTLCHATGSATNPYVDITISANAVPAHERHQDGRDIIPAPASGCPGGSAQPRGDNGNEHGKVTICHATGSEKNPYVVITISENALPAHLAHQDGEDIYPVPAGGCPSTAVPPGLGNPPSGIVSPPGSELPAAGAPTADAPSAEAPAPESGVLGVSEEREGNGAGEEGAVMGANQGSGSDQPVEATGDAGTSLPFTGLQLLVLAAAGVVLALAGFRLRRSAA